MAPNNLCVGVRLLKWLHAFSCAVKQLPQSQFDEAGHIPILFFDPDSFLFRRAGISFCIAFVMPQLH